MGKPAVAVDPDQVPLPIFLPCACRCGRSVEQPRVRGSGRPRRYFEDACRKSAQRRRQEEAERERMAAERERVQRQHDQEHAAALAALEDRDVAEWVCIWRRTLGAGYQKLTARQVLAVQEQLQRDLPFLGHPLESVRDAKRETYREEARRALEGLHGHRALAS